MQREIELPASEAVVEAQEAQLCLADIDGEETLRYQESPEDLGDTMPEVLGMEEEETPIPEEAGEEAWQLECTSEIVEEDTGGLGVGRWGKIRAGRDIPVLLTCVLVLVIVVFVECSILAVDELRGSLLMSLAPYVVSSGHGSLASLSGSTPLTPTRSPTLQAQPVQPFPPTLTAEIATLEAHNRFFYRGNPALPEIALTFDDGPSPAYTPQVLAILKKYHVNATFFDVGRLVQTYPDLAREELSDGNLVGNHSWTHPDLPTLTESAIEAQLQQTSDEIEKVTGVRPTFMRPPYGDISPRVLTVVNKLALTAAIWNDEAMDWALPGTSVIVARILRQANNGAIILLHDGGGNRFQTVAALPSIIEQLRARGYSFVTMDEMVAHISKPHP